VRPHLLERLFEPVARLGVEPFDEFLELLL